MMLNKRPIFINALARGGSNILMNLLMSHPGVCVSNGETHKVFKGTKWDPIWRKVKKRICYDYPIRLMAGHDVFAPENLEPRRPISDSLQRYIDHILYYGRFTTMIDTHNRYKFEGVEYTRDELAQCRLLTKALGGTVLTVDMFRDMYPDAVFFGLVRNGLAVCEGFVRRGFSARETGLMYKSVVEKILEASDGMENYHFVKYEDMVSRPYEFMQDIYKHADLDFGEVKKARLQSKKIMDSSGKRSRIKGGDRQVFWYEPSSLSQQIKSDINENQIKQLKPDDRDIFMSVAGDVMRRCGYNEG